MNGKIIEADYTINGKISSADSTLKGRVNKLYELRGYSAYEVAVLEGFEGTEEEWLASLKGEQGEKGDKGDKGEKGEKGEKGDSGTGTGDMLAGVYDPQGKKKDIFAEISKSALSDLSNVSNDVMKAKVEASGFVSGGGVESFNGRQGAVVPMAGDYTAEQVGARSNTWMPNAEDTGAAKDDLSNVSNEVMKAKVEESGFSGGSSIPLVESTEYPGCYYRMVDGVKEWLNPPTASDIEYRTTGRFAGMALYRKAVSTGYLAAGNHTIAHGVSGIVYPYSIDVVNMGGYCITNANGNTVSFDRTNITFATTSAQGSINFVIEYTKS